MHIADMQTLNITVLWDHIEMKIYKSKLLTA